MKDDDTFSSPACASPLFTYKSRVFSFRRFTIPIYFYVYMNPSLQFTYSCFLISISLTFNALLPPSLPPSLPPLLVPV
jgi:hypothetical protein